MVSNLLFVTLLVVKCASCLYEVKRGPPNKQLSPCTLIPSRELCFKNGVQFTVKYYCNTKEVQNSKHSNIDLSPDQASLSISTSHDGKELQTFSLVNPKEVPINPRDSIKDIIKKENSLCDSFRAKVEIHGINENKITIEYFNSDMWYCLVIKGNKDRREDKCNIIEEENNMQLDKDYKSAQLHKGLPEGYSPCTNKYQRHTVCSADGVQFEARYSCTSGDSLLYKLVAKRGNVKIASYKISNSFMITKYNDPDMEKACSLFKVHVPSDRNEVWIQYFNDGNWWCNCFKHKSDRYTSCGLSSSSQKCERYRDYDIP